MVIWWTGIGTQVWLKSQYFFCLITSYPDIQRSLLYWIRSPSRLLPNLSSWNSTMALATFPALSRPLFSEYKTLFFSLKYMRDWERKEKTSQEICEEGDEALVSEAASSLKAGLRLEYISESVVPSPRSAIWQKSRF